MKVSIESVHLDYGVCDNLLSYSCYDNKILLYSDRRKKEEVS